MDFCNITLQIIKFPKMDVKKWGIKKVRDFLAYKTHVEECTICSALMDAFLADHPEKPEGIDPTSLN